VGGRQASTGKTRFDLEMSDFLESKTKKHALLAVALLSSKSKNDYRRSCKSGPSVESINDPARLFLSFSLSFSLPHSLSPLSLSLSSLSPSSSSSSFNTSSVCGCAHTLFAHPTPILALFLNIMRVLCFVAQIYLSLSSLSLLSLSLLSLYSLSLLSFWRAQST